MEEKSEARPKFFRDRLLGIFDNLVSSAILYGLGILLPVVLGIILRLEFHVILLILLLVGQAIVVLLLLSIRRGLSNRAEKKELMVQSADTNAVYLIDRFGLSHLIKDADTALYLMQILGYQSDELKKVAPTALRPPGAEVTAIRQFRRPLGRQDKMTNQARTSLKCSPKRFRTEGGSRVLFFDIRNDSDYSMLIDSARLVFDMDAPLSSADPAPQHRPTAAGLLACKLLFNGESESKKLSAREESRLDLALRRNLTEEECAEIAGARLGHIEIAGMFRDAQVTFHIYV
jgi:hypothetical protein